MKKLKSPLILSLLITLNLFASKAFATPLTASATASASKICKRDSVTLTASASGGVAPYTYIWIPNTGIACNTCAITNAAPTHITTFTVNVIDHIGEKTIATVTVNVDTLTVSLSSSTLNPCYGSVVYLNATASYGTTPYTYTWTPTGILSNSSIYNPYYTATATKTFTCKVKDNFGCKVTETITETVDNITLLPITTNTVCPGSTGSLTANVAISTFPPYTYSWSPGGQTNQTATGLSAGTYTVTVTDANGCSATASGSVVNYTPPTVTAMDSASEICNGDTTWLVATVSGGRTPYVYNWSPSGSLVCSTCKKTEASPNSSKTYTVTVTDAHGCSATASVSLTVDPALSLSLSSSATVPCQGSVVNLDATPSGGTSPYTYSWTPTGILSNSSIYNPSYTAVSNKTFTCTVTDNFGCSVTASIKEKVDDIVVSINALTVCSGYSASLMAVVSGTHTLTPYTYSWAPGGQTNSTATGLSSGTYTVTVTDARGCMGSASAIAITQPPVLISDSIISSNSPTCNGSSNGSATVGTSGGTSPYTYLWSPGGMTTATATGLSADTYTIITQDQHGCSGVLNFTMTQPAALVDSMTLFSAGLCSGTVTVAMVGKHGISPYTYTWSGGQTTDTVALSAGSYVSTVTDANGCSVTAAVIVTQPAALSASISYESNPVCNGGNGVAVATGTAGEYPYTYSWTGGGTNQVMTTLSAGSYSVTITDIRGCIASASVTLTQPPAIRDSIVSSSIVNVSYFGASDGSATVGVKYGTLPYTYSWYPNVSSTATATGLSAGTYYVVITDSNECMSGTSASVTITQPSYLSYRLISPITETVYSGGTPTTILTACTQDSIVYRITETTPTSDTLYIKLPDGITYNSLLSASDSDATVSYLHSADSVPEFQVTPVGSTFKFTVLVNTPPCNALHTSNQQTKVWAKGSADTATMSDILSILDPELTVKDISLPNPISLGVGNVDEFVFALTDFTNSTQISKVYFTASPDPNISFYPVATPTYYLTYNSGRGLSGYYTKYTYNLLPHSYSSPLLPYDTIYPATINSLIGHPLEKNDTIYVHIPYKVLSCNDTNGRFHFYTVCSLDSAICNSYTDTTQVNVGLTVGNPILSFGAVIDTIDFASYCYKTRKDSETFKFRCINNGGRWFSDPPGNGRADSIRIFLSNTLGTGHIKTSTIRINNVPISTSYITSMTDGHFDVTEINLTNYPAGVNGEPFGANTIQDLDGFNYADAMAEKDTFYVSGLFIYDTTSCLPFVQCASVESPTTFDIPGIGAKYNNECFTIARNDSRVDTGLVISAAYQYSAGSGASTVTAPPDIQANTPFDLTICPEYSQTWSPAPFDFGCPHAYWSMDVNLPKDYDIDTADHSIFRLYAANANSQHSNMYEYLPLCVANGEPCNSNTDTLHPLFEEVYNGHDTVLVINFGRIDSTNCGSIMTMNLPCINIPLVLDCDTALHHAYIDTVDFTLQYTCDSACNDCSDILTCGNTTTYNHPCGTTQNIPFTTDIDLTIFRTNLGFINQDLPSYYTQYCSTSPLIIPSISDSLKNKSDTIVNTGAGYPGDQVETTVEGGYSGLTPRDFTSEYLQIRHPVYAGSPHKGYLFELDPDSTSYFIMNGCAGVPALNGQRLIIPNGTRFYTDTSSGIVGSTVYMNFKIDTAIYNTFPSLYSAWMNDNITEGITLYAQLHLRVWNPDISPSSWAVISPLGDNIINLRNEYMCVQKPGGFSADSLHSSDSWGTRFDIYQPNSTNVGIGGSSPSVCSAFQVSIAFAQYGTPGLNGDFPNEFRPLFMLDSAETIILPAGYVYDSTSFYTNIDTYTSNSATNYFTDGIQREYFHMVPRYNSNPLGNPSLPTTLIYHGLNNSCWPLVDQKLFYQEYSNSIYTSPVCNVASPDTFYRIAGYRMYTQQPDTNFQIHFLPVITASIPTHHVNPVVKIGIPPVVSDYSNQITFTFTLCDSGSYATANAWVAFENPGLDTLNMLTATLTNLYTHQQYYANIFDDSNGVYFNLGNINSYTCETLVFSALIDSNSHSCPLPKDSGNGSLKVKYGISCNDTLSDPNKHGCEDDSVFFDYHIYANDLELANTSHLYDTVRLCGGHLVDSLTITSADLGTISDPEFWAVEPLGVTIDSIVFRHPCDGAKDTNIHIPDVIYPSSGGSKTELGWNLNKDLRIHGLRGLLGAQPLNDSNTVCIRVYMTFDCEYAQAPIVFYTQGISTCSIIDSAAVSIVPLTDSSCCRSCRLAATILTGDTILCAGDSTIAIAKISVSGTPPYTYSWSPSGQTTDTIYILTGGTYSVTVFDAGGCFSTSTVTIHYYPIPMPHIKGSISNCGNSLFMYADTNTANGITYSWVARGGTPSSGSGDTAYTSFYPNGGIIVWTASDTFGCSLTDSLVVLRSTPIPRIKGSASNCGGGLFVYADTNTASGITYTWVARGGTPSSGNGDTAYTNFNPNGGAIIWTASDTLGCILTDSLTVLRSTPIPHIKGSTFNCDSSLYTYVDTNTASGITYSWIARGGTPALGNGDTAQTNFNPYGGTIIWTARDSIGCTLSDSLVVSPCIADCWAYRHYDTILKNTRASSLARAIHNNYYECKTILIQGTFTVDTDFTFYAVDAELTPHALINVVDSANFWVEQGDCSTFTSHLHASCDTMWRGIFVHPGALFGSVDDPLIEDADTALFLMNDSGSVQSLYNVSITTFNKNWKDIVVQNYHGDYLGHAGISLFTCRNFDSILTHPPFNWVNMGNNYNWVHAHDTTLLYPHQGQKTYMGWEFANVKDFNEAENLGGANVFDNLTYGIFSVSSNITIVTDTFQNIVNSNPQEAAIYAIGINSDTLVVGAPYIPDVFTMGNVFKNCSTGVYAYYNLGKVDVSYNSFYDSLNTPTIGVAIQGPIPWGGTIIIDSNRIHGATVGIQSVMTEISHARIDTNVITGRSQCDSAVGIYISETGGRRAIYNVERNTIQDLHYGIYANDAYADTIYKNGILLTGDTGCVNPVAKGIAIIGGSNAQVVANTVSMNNYSSVSDYNNTDFKGIYVENSPSCNMTCNILNYLDTAIICSGAGDAGAFNVLNNTMNAGNNSYAVGISLPNGSLIGQQGLLGTPSDNEWNGTFSCNSYVPFPTNRFNAPFVVQTASGYDPDLGSCSPNIYVPFTTSGTSINCGSVPPIHLDLLDTIARREISYDEYPDTTNIIAKSALTEVLWNNTSLLSLDTILSNFNDSISTTSLGDIMRADSAMINSNSTLAGTAYPGYFTTLTPASNIEAHLQTVGKIILNARSTGASTLTSTELSALETLANKCPYTDGIGVYQARTLLDYYTGRVTLYNDESCGSRSGRKPVKHNENTEKNDSISNVSVNIYPNPNNGNFTLAYNLGSQTSGRMELYNQVGMKIAEYFLTSPMGSKQISVPNLSQGLYIYKLYAGGEIIKVGKIIIMK